MAIVYQNITGNTAVTLISNYDNTVSLSLEELKYIYLTNVHATDSCIIDLYITKVEPYDYTNQSSNDYTVYEDITSTYYLLKQVTIPFGVTLKLGRDDLKYDEIYTLYLQLGAADSAVDVRVETQTL